MRRLNALIVPSNSFRSNEVSNSLYGYLALQAAEVGLSELNIGNNFFTPECLYKLCYTAICKIPSMQRLVIAFSNLGEVGKNYIGGEVLELMK